MTPMAGDRLKLMTTCNVARLPNNAGIFIKWLFDLHRLSPLPNGSDMVKESVYLPRVSWKSDRSFAEVHLLLHTPGLARKSGLNINGTSGVTILSEGAYICQTSQLGENVNRLTKTTSQLLTSHRTKTPWSGKDWAWGQNMSSQTSLTHCVFQNCMVCVVQCGTGL